MEFHNFTPLVSLVLCRGNHNQYEAVVAKRTLRNKWIKKWQDKIMIDSFEITHLTAQVLV